MKSDSAYRDIAKHGAIYGLGQILTRLASFLLLPLYTSYLTPTDYGCIAVLDLTVTLLGLLIGIQISTAVARYHFEFESEIERDKVWWTGLTILGSMSIGIVVVGLACRHWLASLTLGSTIPEGDYFYTLSIITLGCVTVGEFLNDYFRVRKWSVLCISISVARLLVNVALNVFFLVGLKMGIAGVLLGNLITNGLFAGASFMFFMSSRGGYQFQKSLVPKYWTFAFPLVVAAMLGLVMQQAGRYFVNYFGDLHQVGIYSLASTMGHAVNTLILLPFLQIWGVVIYEIAKRGNAKAIYASVFRYFVEFLGLIMLCASVLAEPIVRIMAAPEYLEAARLIPIVCLGCVFYSMHPHFAVPALIAKRTANILPSHFVGAIANLVLNLFLVRIWGPYGAALSGVLASAAYSLVGYMVYRRIDQYQYPFFRCGVVIGGMVACYFGHLYLIQLGFSPTILVVASLICITVWFVLLSVPLVIRLRQSSIVKTDKKGAEEQAVAISVPDEDCQLVAHE